MDQEQIAFLRRLNSALPKEKRHALPVHSPRTGTYARHTPDSLHALGNSEYAKLVTDNLGHEHQELWDHFLSPAFIHRTHVALIRKRAATVRLLREPRHESRKQQTRLYLNLINERLEQVESALDDDVVQAQRLTIRRLTAAIQTHRAALRDAGIEPEPWDLHLWKTLDAADDMMPTDDTGRSAI